jgi:hypothetical protein
MKITQENCEIRPGAKKALCGKCKKPFILDAKEGWKATPVVVETERSGWHRGEDSVRFFHPKCHQGKG